MALYPVIMCGGGGTRLWPASRPARPKQFMPLVGDRTLFQETALRVAPLAEGGGRLVVVAGVAHEPLVRSQLAAVGLEAELLLEPEPRDSAPAMAAAAALIARLDPVATAVFVASDHHIPDHQAFRDAVRAAAAAAAGGRIVTLGVRPTEPSPAYGYIEPSGRGLSVVRRFVEKPDRDTAERHILSGFLWNSGNFIAPVATLTAELRAHAPAVLAAAEAALPAPGEAVLGAGFSDAPKISIDYAVMEKTVVASVLEVDFQWSDLGSWDAVAASVGHAPASLILEDAEGCFVRAPEGVLVAVLGVRDLAVIVEPDAVLVADLARAQDLKRIVERVKAESPRHLDIEQTAQLPD
jgi:mannose-1-phosphate guanylyltransferase/mannose-6-phosphate isomerase